MDVQEINPSRVDQYQKLFLVCFPKSRMSPEYINWLYFQNPLGTVVGFDAIEGDRTISHYACIPTEIDGVIGLLSLNTATHPDFRSQGLHKILAKKTFERWSRNFHFVVGVANAQSAGNFVKHLGFTELGRLNLRYGSLHRPHIGSRSWTSEQIEWRASSPSRKFQKNFVSNNLIELVVHPKGFPFNLKSIVPISSTGTDEILGAKKVERFGFTVDWIRDSRPAVQLPEWFKPSPLVLIFKSLSGTRFEVNSWSFPDFDVF